MRGFLLALTIVSGGCAQAPRHAAVGPSALDQETALEIVWENAYGMERASRPASIRWWPTNGCHEDLDVTGFTEADPGICAADSESSTGNIYIRWEGSFAASNFARALVMWRQYLMTGTMTKPSEGDLELISIANDNLKTAGL